VRQEIIVLSKGMLSATLCPALSLHLAQRGLSQAYCGVGEGGYSWLIVEFLAIWITVDLWEFTYHRLGHLYDSLWAVHKHHHQFFNPSPFAVIADEYLDQFCRSLPLVIFPYLVPVNMDLMFFQFGLFFYAYGVYLHWGHELEYPDAHHPFINTSFQHYLHHAISIKNKPYHTGFFFKLWDQICGSVYDGKCFCVKCAQKNGERTLDLWKQVEKPDYSPLLNPSFWLNAPLEKDPQTSN